MTKRRRTDNTMAKRRRTDNTMAKRRRTDNTMTKRKKTKGQTTIYIVRVDCIKSNREQYFVVVSFIVGRNQSTQRKIPT